MKTRLTIGVLGASSLVGAGLLPMLNEEGRHVLAFSRHAINAAEREVIQWLPPGTDLGDEEVHYWVCLAPIWVLPDYFDWMRRHGARHVVALSSTSRFTKTASSDPTECDLAQRFADSEERLIAWAESQGISWTIFRPTLIYGLGLDKNINQIASLIRRFGFFPLLGDAKGLRQPIHLQDLASVCLAALETPAAANRAFNVSGAEVLSYREMVARIFTTLGKPVHFIRVPLWAFRMAVTGMKLLPAFRKWSPAMVERMNADMVFDHSGAAQQLGFSPRGFVLQPEDL